MMKKLLVLMLVIGMASLASATPLITASATTVEQNESVSIYITGTSDDVTGAGGDPAEAGGGWFYLWLDYSTNAFSNDAYLSLGMTATKENAAGAEGAVEETYPNYGLSFSAYPGVAIPYVETDDVDEGLWYTFTVTAGTVLGTTTVQLWNGLTTILGSIDITVVPEPMTIALLGLGGLFLRRRRK